MINGPGFDEDAILDLINNFEASNPTKTHATLGELAEALDPTGVRSARPSGGADQALASSAPVSSDHRMILS